MFPSGFNLKLPHLFCNGSSYWLGNSATHTTPRSVFGLVQLEPKLSESTPLEPDALEFNAVDLEIAHLETANLEIPNGSIVDSDVPPSIQTLLQLAQHQLQASHMPAAIKIALYLKICCLAIQKSFLAEQPIPAERLYHNLMQWLSECEPQWWQECSITESGITSDNARIRDLLQPLADFVQQFLEG